DGEGALERRLRGSFLQDPPPVSVCPGSTAPTTGPWQFSCTWLSSRLECYRRLNRPDQVQPGAMGVGGVMVMELGDPVSQDFLLHSSLGGSQPEAGSGGRLTLGAQTLPSDTACSCEACSERRESSAEADREPQQLQNYWSEVRYTVRCIYRQAGTPLADDQDQSLVPDKEGVKELVDRYMPPLPVVALCKPLACPLR
ncbi:hypothetical protein P7K49_005898, partial [Saguinus oedipus]